jgi:hypothetical protein
MRAITRTAVIRDAMDWIMKSALAHSLSGMVSVGLLQSTDDGIDRGKCAGLTFQLFRLLRRVDLPGQRDGIAIYLYLDVVSKNGVGRSPLAEEDAGPPCLDLVASSVRHPLPLRPCSFSLLVGRRGWENSPMVC